MLSAQAEGTTFYETLSCNTLVGKKKKKDHDPCPESVRTMVFTFGKVPWSSFVDSASAAVPVDTTLRLETRINRQGTWPS